MHADISGSVRTQRKRRFLPFLHSKFYILNSHSGFSIIELLLVLGITAILSTFIFAGFLKSRQENDLQNTARQIVSVLREAQNRSVVQAMNTNWLVWFYNATSSQPYYALRAVVTSTVTEIGHYVLPKSVAFSTSTLPLNSSSSIIFGSLSGKVAIASTTSIGLYLTSNPTHSVTIVIATSGAVSF